MLPTWQVFASCPAELKLRFFRTPAEELKEKDEVVAALLAKQARQGRPRAFLSTRSFFTAPQDSGHTHLKCFFARAELHELS